MKGIIYVKVALYLECDATEDERNQIVSDMNYEFQHPLISSTKIKDII